VENNVNDFLRYFTGILYEALPFIILGSVIAGFLEELVPQSLVVRLIPRNRILAIAIGGFLGLLFPMCECGIIVIMRRLLRKGVPLSSCVCYMLAGPILNVVVMLSTYVAFRGMDQGITSSGQPTYHPGGLGMMGLRMTFGYLVAFGTSLIVEWQYRKHGNRLLAPLAIPAALIPPKVGLVGFAELRSFKEDVCATAETAVIATAEVGTAPNREPNGDGAADEPEPAEVRKPWSERVSAITETALHDFVDVTVYLIFGALLAAGARLLLTHQQMEQLSRNQPALTILAMMGLAIVLCLCSEADAFVAASFVSLAPAAKLAFLVLGPMLDFKLYMMYLRVFRPRLIWTIITSVVIQVFIYSLLFHFLWLAYGAAWFPGPTRP
jgi:uncharacterized membrane protein YraQ (UPF0718 family)